MGIETAIAGAAIGGSLINSFGQAKVAKKQGQRSDQMFRTATGMIQNDPSQWENMIQAGAQLPFNNAGNDALMQLLRSDPSRQTSNVTGQLQSILDGRMGYNTDPLFESLDKLDARAQSRAAATIGAQAGTLGARFGSAVQQRTAGAVGQMVDQASARNQQLGLQIYGQNQSNRLNAAQMLLGAQNQAFGQQLGAAQALNAQELATRSSQLDWLRSGAAAQQGRQGQNAQFLGMASGIPVAPSPLGTLGSGISDAAQFAYLMKALGGGSGGGVSSMGMMPQGSNFGGFNLDPNILFRGY
jgi:hypothetical protein